MPIAKAGYTNLQMSASTIIFVQGLWSGARKPALAIGRPLWPIKSKEGKEVE